MAKGRGKPSRGTIGSTVYYWSCLSTPPAAQLYFSTGLHIKTLFKLVCNSTCSNSRQHPLLTDCLCWRQRKQHQPYFKLPQLTLQLGSLPSFHVIAKDAVSALCLYIFASLSFSCLANLVALLQWGASGHVMHVFPWDTLHLPLIITQLLIIMPQIIQLGSEFRGEFRGDF